MRWLLLKMTEIVSSGYSQILGKRGSEENSDEEVEKNLFTILWGTICIMEESGRLGSDENLIQIGKFTKELWR